MKAMLPRHALVLSVITCFYLLVSTSCLVRRRLIVRKGGSTRQQLLTAGKQDLIDHIVRQYQSILDLNATLDMVPALGSAEKSKITEYKDVRGYVLFRKPADIRIIGLYPVVRNKAFDMVSNGAEFRLYIPSKNRFITGQNEIVKPSKNKIENLRPQHFLEALLVRPPQEFEKTFLVNFTDEDEAFYILHLVRAAPDGALVPSRAVWFDRLNLRLVRQLIFDNAGNILTDARYGDWQSYDGVPFPKHVEINRPRDEYALVLTFVKLDINKGVSDDKFILERPEGSQLQVVGQPPEAPKEPPAPPKPSGKRKRDL